MGTKGNTTIIAIAGVTLAILAILIIVAGFFIISELNRPAEFPAAPAPAGQVSGETPADTGNGDALPSPGEDKDNDGIPDRIQGLIDASQIPSTTTSTGPAPDADANDNDIPDRIENLIPTTLPQAPTSTSGATAPPSDPNADLNNNGIPDRIENLMK